MTIRDIANAAGVSVATVSKVLNHRDQNISQETKERILQIIKDSGYVPYAKIRDRLLTGTNTIGLAVPSLDISYYASFVSRVQALARQQRGGACCAGELSGYQGCWNSVFSVQRGGVAGASAAPRGRVWRGHPGLYDGKRSVPPGVSGK